MNMGKYINTDSPFAWNKKGHVDIEAYKHFTHASHPTVVHYKDDIFILAFTQRDEHQHSHIFLAKIKMYEDSIEVLEEPKLALYPGKMGAFDMNGVISGCFVQDKGKCYLYYCGWQTLAGGLWSCNTGRAIVDVENLTLTREFLGPVIATNKKNPMCAGATVFYFVAEKWHTLYNSVLEWIPQSDGILRPLYGLHHGTSDDGIDWEYDDKICIPFADEYEYAFGRPTVIKVDDIYYLWFACRATKNTDTYRIGFAWSKDGVNWTRNDKIVGIDVSETGWDSEMICYPCVFQHKDKTYMLYNGNGYGKTGFGLAVLEDK